MQLKKYPFETKLFFLSRYANNTLNTIKETDPLVPIAQAAYAPTHWAQSIH